jgi:P-type Mg2+ transporter
MRTPPAIENMLPKFELVPIIIDLGVVRKFMLHTGWFVESLSTQILVIFIIRTAQPLQDRPHAALVVSSLFAFIIAVTLPYLPLARWFGFAPLPAEVHYRLI